MLRPLPRVLIILVSASFLLTTLSCARPIAPDPVDREIENLRAFAKLYGQVRWFHPSAGAAAADWNAFAVDGVAAARDARDASALREALEWHLAAVSDGIEISTTEPSSDPSVRCEDDHAWQHLGFGGRSVYHSVVAQRDGEIGNAHSAVQVVRELPVEALRGSTLTVTGSGLTDSVGAATLRVDVVDAAGNQRREMDYLRDGWQAHTVSTAVPPDATRVWVAVSTWGTARSEFGGFEMAAVRDGAPIDLEVTNADFSAGADGWIVDGQGGYTVTPSERDGRPTLVLASRPPVGPRLYEEFPSPGEVVTTALGGGVWSRVPLTTCDPPAEHPVETPPEVEDSPDVRIAAVVVAWNALQHFYPYFDLIEVDWDRALTDSLHGAIAASSMDELTPVLLRLVALIGDAHGIYLHPSMQSLRAPPVQVALVEGEPIVVASEAEGVEVGDRVISIDDEPAPGYFGRLTGEISGTPQWKAYLAGMRWFGVGDPEAPAQMTLDREGVERTVEVPRTSRVWRRLGTPVVESIAEVEPGIWYVDLGRATASQIQAMVETLATAEGLVFDMRGYPSDFRGSALGHLAEEKLYSPRFYLPKAIRPDREGLTHQFGQWYVEPAEPRFRGRAVMLIGPGAVSAAETVASLFAFHDLGELVGSPTAGANGNIAAATLPGGGRVVFTGMRLRNQDGTELHLRGVQPTVQVEPTIEGIRAGRDEVLERAVEILRR